MHLRGRFTLAFMFLLLWRQTDELSLEGVCLGWPWPRVSGGVRAQRDRSRRCSGGRHAGVVSCARNEVICAVWCSVRRRGRGWGRKWCHCLLKCSATSIKRKTASDPTPASPFRLYRSGYLLISWNVFFFVVTS